MPRRRLTRAEQDAYERAHEVTQTTIRLPGDVPGRADAVAVRMPADWLSLTSPTRSTVLRVALDRGLGELEADPARAVRRRAPAEWRLDHSVQLALRLPRSLLDRAEALAPRLARCRGRRHGRSRGRRW